MSNFFKTLDAKRDFYLEHSNTEALSILYRLEAYIESGKYTKVKKASQYFALRKLKAKESAEMLGVSAETVKRARFTLSNDAWNSVGESFFDSLDKGDYQWCNDCLDRLLGSSHLTNVLPSGVVSLIEGLSSGEDVKLLEGKQPISTFVEEVNFLATVSEPYIKALVSNLDVSRLRYLLGVLDGSKGTREDYFSLVNYIMEKAGEKL